MALPGVTSLPAKCKAESARAVYFWLMPLLSAGRMLSLFTLLFCCSSCFKKDLKGKLPDGQIALTFDDANVDNWHSYLPLLDSLHIKATFYISHYHTLSAEQKQKIFDLQRAGHEIAYHTTNHLDLPKEVTKIGLALTERREIAEDLRLMQADGFTITNFAYPYGSHSNELDQCLLRRFKSVRALCSYPNYEKSLVKESGEGKVLYGANADNNSRLKEEGMANLMTKAKENRDCLVLVGHQINNKNIKLQISRDRLIFLARTAAEKNLEFITINKIATK